MPTSFNWCMDCPSSLISSSLFPWFPVCPLGTWKVQIPVGHSPFPFLLITATAWKDVFIHFIIMALFLSYATGTTRIQCIFFSPPSSTCPNNLTLLGLGSKDPTESATLAWPDVRSTTLSPTCLTVHQLHYYEEVQGQDTSFYDCPSCTLHLLCEWSSWVQTHSVWVCSISWSFLEMVLTAIDRFMGWFTLEIRWILWAVPKYIFSGSLSFNFQSRVG